MPKKPKPKPKKRKQRRAINKKPAFLAAFVVSASLTEAAAAVGIDRGQHYDWLEKDPVYAAAFDRAKLQAADTLRDDAVEWARKGIFEPIVYQGQFQFAQREVTLCTLPDGREVRTDQLPEPIGDVEIVSRRTILESYGPPLGVHRRSEGLLARRWKSLAPEDFTDRGEISGPKGGPIPLEQKQLQKLTDDELASLIATVKKLTSDGGDGSGTPPAPAQ